MATSASDPKRIVVLISGSGTNLQALINAIEENEINGEIVGVLSNRKSAYGLVRAADAGIPTQVISYAPFREQDNGRVKYDAHLGDVVSELNPDWIVLAGFMRILSVEFLARFPNQVINLHPALPGAFPGTDAIARAWSSHENEGLNETGVMVHFVVEAVDAGPVLGTRSLDMRSSDTLADLESAMHGLEHELLVEVIRSLCTDEFEAI